MVHGFLNLLHDEPTIPRRLRVAQESLSKNPDIRVMPADKGSMVVILDTDEYIRAGEDMLSDRAVYKKLNSTNPIIYRVTSFNNSLKSIFPENSKLLKQFWIHGTSDQRLPFLYLLPKIHKPSPPLKFRPIVSQFATYNAPLSKFVANILKPLVGSFSDSHLTNTSDFTSQLTTFYRNNPRYLSAPLLSLDVESLFTNVPLGDVTGFLRRKLIDNSNLNLPDGLTIDILIKLIELCCASTIFSFNGSFYQQKFGVAMGSPLACILANIFMEYFETELRFSSSIAACLLEEKCR